MAVDAGTGAWLPQEPGPAMPAGFQPALPARGRRARIGTPEPLARGLPPAPELRSFRASTTSGPLGTGSAPRRQGPGPTILGPRRVLSPVAEVSFWIPGRWGAPARPPLGPPTQSRQAWPRANSRPSGAWPCSHNAPTTVACPDQDPAGGQEGVGAGVLTDGPALPRAGTRAGSLIPGERG